MFGELFERTFHLDESEKTIRTIYKIYKDHERGLDPDIDDLDVALEGLSNYYEDYIQYWARGGEKFTPKDLKAAYEDRFDEIMSALASNNLRDKIIAVDNAINQWHIDFPVIGHLEMDAETEDEEGERSLELADLVNDTMEILRRLGRFPEESPYIR